VNLGSRKKSRVKLTQPQNRESGARIEWFLFWTMPGNRNTFHDFDNLKNGRFMGVLKMIRFTPGNPFHGKKTATRKGDKLERKNSFRATPGKNGTAPTRHTLHSH